ncbi:MAG: hypothetical protein MUO26_00945 [Methanotrichaceae archaeon]|nr:hypothetical protein [Methanotrichaceae archaeon]
MNKLTRSDSKKEETTFPTSIPAVNSSSTLNGDVPARLIAEQPQQDMQRILSKK